MDLCRSSGLPLELKGTQLIFWRDDMAVAPVVHTLKDMRPVLMDSNEEASEEQYWMYRNVALPEHKEKLAETGLRYDITVISPGRVGREYVKTFGHYHSFKRGTAVSYPEVYEVLHGQAFYIMQRSNGCDSRVSNFVSVMADTGDKVVIPPNYGHATVNIGSEPLVIAKWVAEDSDPNYDDMRQQVGMAYYVVESKDGRPLFVFNESYDFVASIGCVEPCDYPEFGLYHNNPMYRVIEESPEKLDFLTRPEYFNATFYKYISCNSDIVWRPASIMGGNY